MTRPALTTALAIPVALALALPAMAAPPTAAELLERVLTAAGGQQAFAGLGVVELTVGDEETRLDGTTASGSGHAYASGAHLEHLRVEHSNGLVLVRGGGTGWATMNGQPDRRPQTPKMAMGTVTQSLFPLLLPFSLGMDGVTLGAVTEVTFDGAPAWRLEVSFAKDFFANPVLVTRWLVHVSRASGAVLAAEFQPAESLAHSGATGMRYRVLETQRVGACRLPAHVLAEGVDGNGAPTGQTRVSRVTAVVRGPHDPALFLSPDQLKAIDGED